MAASVGSALLARKSAAEAPLPSPDRIVAVTPPVTPPAARFSTLDGAPVTFAALAGRPAVVNCWATWCVPCVRELPALDALAASHGDIAVVAISSDHGGATVVRPFAAAHGVTHLALWLDPTSAQIRALGVFGYPTTLVLDAAGRLRGRLEGPVDWSTAAGRIEALTG